MSKLTRRKFLQSTAATFAAPYVITSTALGAEGHPAASNRLTMGFIGVGGMGGGQCGSFLGYNEVQVVAICDVRKDTRDGWQTRANERYAEDTKSGTYKGCAAYNDYRELLARDDIDLVLIATPDHWHAIIAIEAAKAGKDIYCQKPMSLTIREAQMMRDNVRLYDRVFQTGSQQRSDQKFRFACELVRNGRIGKVQTIHVGVGGPSGENPLAEQPIPAGFDYDMWLGPAPWKPYNSYRVDPTGWREQRDYSGGQMTDWGAHHFDIAQWGLGMDGSGPVEIHPPNGKEYPTLTYKYANGTTMYHGAVGDINPNGVLFTGTEGKVEVNRGYLRTWPDSLAKEFIGPDEVHLYESNDHQQDWLNCVKSRQKPICDVAIGASSVTVCHLGNIAYWLNRPLRWNPDQEEFENDAEANRWLDRPKRTPWHLP